MFTLLTIFTAIDLIAIAFCLFNIVLSLFYKKIYKLTGYFIGLFITCVCTGAGWLFFKNVEAKNFFSQFLYLLSQAGDSNTLASVVLFSHLVLYLVIGIYIYICIRRFVKGVKHVASEVGETVKYTKDAVKRSSEKILPFKKEETVEEQPVVFDSVTPTQETEQSEEEPQNL